MDEISKLNIPYKIELDFLDRRSDADETECYWLITDTWDFGIHTYISIEIKEVL